MQVALLCAGLAQRLVDHDHPPVAVAGADPHVQAVHQRPPEHGLVFEAAPGLVVVADVVQHHVAVRPVAPGAGLRDHLGGELPPRAVGAGQFQPLRLLGRTLLVAEPAQDPFAVAAQPFGADQLAERPADGLGDRAAEQVRSRAVPRRHRPGGVQAGDRLRHAVEHRLHALPLPGRLGWFGPGQPHRDLGFGQRGQILQDAQLLAAPLPGPVVDHAQHTQHLRGTGPQRHPGVRGRVPVPGGFDPAPALVGAGVGHGQRRAGGHDVPAQGL
ncbi:hypothetical protein GCM10014719_60860 [Planomonospora parontospora subsp. antibiotica]|nr:hypothetical protein [Planomonospora parontospora]GGL51434.1 hypothetical protein GCM10014719_60860 [Planomonospora parontospora subsp. antibiotica]GII19103.1 hypothetical protein Ppa05_58290 [Planomonospora parontospora subsp. antibiotica]